MTVDPAVAKQVVLDYKRSKGWHFGGPANRLNRHKGFFVFRRTLILGDQNPTWLADPALSSLKAQIDTDLGTVQTYLAGKLGTSASRGPYWGGADPTSPPHLDLLDMAQQKTSQPTISTTDVFPRPHGAGGNRAYSAFDLRKNWVEAIVWRATGIHPELLQPTFQSAALDELLDHRLRMVERMKYNVTAGAMIGDRGGLTFGPATSGWVDGFRNRLFEYPRIGVGLERGHIPPTFIADPHTDSTKKRWLTFSDAGQTDWWFVDDFERRLLWNEPPYAGTRFPPGLRDHWTRHPGAGATTNDNGGNYRLYMTPTSGLKESDVVDLLFPSTHLTDSWDRSWIFCDHVIAALHIDALRFAKHRREGSDATFNSISTTSGVGYISLGGMVGNAGPAQATPPELGVDQADAKFFSNGLVAESDLEVGDHIIFWNCFAYSYVSEGDWRLENTVIMDVDSDPLSGSQHRGQLALQGHGTSILLYSRYIDSIRKYFQGALAKLQAKVRKFAHDNPAETHMPYKGVAYRIIKWSPYEDFDAPGAWWVRIATDDWGKDDAKAAASIGLSVAADPNPVAGYNPPPGPGWVQFPLFQPAIVGGWKAYLDKRKVDPTYLPHTHHLPGKLADVVVHAANMPGLFHDAPVGSERKVPCVRPRVSI